jgi:hypothetical protein
LWSKAFSVRLKSTAETASLISRPRRQRRRLPQFFGSPQVHDRNFPVGHNIVSGCVRGFLRGVRAIRVEIGHRRSRKEQVRLDPVALAIDVRIDAVRSLGVTTSLLSGDVVGRGADPHVAAFVGLLHLPDADVMAANVLSDFWKTRSHEFPTFPASARTQQNRGDYS